MTRARIELALTVVLALAGAALGLMQDVSAPAPLVLGVAALLALATPLGPLLGALGLAAGLGTRPLALAGMAPIEGVIAAVLVGLALGVLARAIAQHLPALRQGERAVELAAFAALVVGLAFLVPDGRALLANGHGDVLRWPALIGDPATLARTPRAFEALVPLARPSDFLAAVMPPLSFAVAFLLLGFRGPRVGRFASRLALLTAALAAAAALIGLGELLLTRPTLDVTAIQRTLNLEGSGAGTLIALGPVSDVGFRLWSRPMVDPVRLVAAICFALTVLPLVGKSLVHKASKSAARATEVLVATSWPIGATYLAGALALGALACAFTFGARPAIVGGLFLGLGALVAGLHGTSADRLPRYALAATGILWFWGIALADRVG